MRKSILSDSEAVKAVCMEVLFVGFATSQRLTSRCSCSLGQIHRVTSEGPQLQFLPPSRPSSFLPSLLSKDNADKKVIAVITLWGLWR